MPHLGAMTHLHDDLQRTLGNAYVIERELGGGGMSRVFVAQDTTLGRSVVVKVLPPDMAGAVNIERFRREIQLVAKLQHACIVPVLSAGAADGMPYYTMPFIEGESLRRRLARGGELPVADAVRILRDVAEALSYAHEHGVVHRDIKPDNILLSKHHAQVADFGVAKALSASTQGEGVTSVGIALGTPAYMAPEQAAADPQIDHRADIYALGVTAYEMLTGTTPFAGRSPQSMLAAHATESPRPLELARPAVPAPLAVLVNRCLAKRAADRPQSADEVLEGLDALVTPTSGLAATTANQLTIRKRRLWIAGAATGVVGVAFVAGFVVFRSRAPALNPKRIVVAELDNETGDTTLTPLGRMTAEWLSRGLEQTGVLDVAISNVGSEGGSDPSAKLRGVARAQAAGAATRSGTVVWGAFYRQNDSIRFQMQATDVNTGKLLRSFEPVTGPVVERDRILESLRQQVVGALASVFDERLMIGTKTRDPVPNYDAYREYAQALDDFYANRYAKALEHGYKALALDSTFVTPYYLIGSVYWNSAQACRGEPTCQGNWASLDSLARVVVALQGSHRNFTTSENDMVEWIVAGSRHDIAGKLRVAERMARRDSSDFNVHFVSLYNFYLNHPGAALDIARRSQQPQHSSGYIGYWQNRVAASHVMGDFKTGLADAALTEKAYPKELGAVRLRALSLAALGDLGATRRLGDSLRVLASDGTNVGPVLTEMGVELRAHGNPAEATQFFQTSVDVQRSRPATVRATTTARGNLAFALYNLERFDEAQAMYDSLTREVTGSVVYLGSAGVVAAARGDRARAMQADSLLASLPGPYLFGLNTRWRARIAASLGDGPGAVALLEQSVTEGWQFELTLHSEKAFERIREYQGFKDFLKPKG